MLVYFEKGYVCDLIDCLNRRRRTVLAGLVWEERKDWRSLVRQMHHSYLHSLTEIVVESVAIACHHILFVLAVAVESEAQIAYHQRIPATDAMAVG